MPLEEKHMPLKMDVKKLQQMSISAPHNIYWLDTNHRYLGCNPHAAWWYSVPIGQVPGLSNKDIPFEEKFGQINKTDIPTCETNNEQVMQKKNNCSI